MIPYDKAFYDTLLQALKDGCQNNRIKLPNPKNIVFVDLGRDTIKIQLSAKAIGLLPGGSCNMQEIDACFEGWALAIKAYYKPEIALKLELDIDDTIDPTQVIDFETIIALTHDHPAYDNARRQKYGHWGRFLYRALRFSQQYSSWFFLAPRLKQLTDAFEVFLTKHKDSLKNNLPNDEATIKGAIKDAKLLDENSFEDMLAKTNRLRKVLINKKLNIGANSYRQLPVGLTLEEAKIFTGRHSAIDLWNIGVDSFDEEALNIIELKYNNKMLGIITELFFYVNYIYDFVSPNHILTLTKFTSAKQAKPPRGYKRLVQLAATGCNTINGIMLANEYHPLVNKELLALMNANSLNNCIHYYIESYDYQIVITPPHS